MVLVVVLAGIDGRATTAGALVTGWVIAAAGVLISLGVVLMLRTA